MKAKRANGMLSSGGIYENDKLVTAEVGTRKREVLTVF